MQDLCRLVHILKKTEWNPKASKNKCNCHVETQDRCTYSFKHTHIIFS